MIKKLFHGRYKRNLLMGRTNNLMIVFKHDLREAFQKNTVTFDNLTYTGGVKNVTVLVRFCAI